MRTLVVLALIWCCSGQFIVPYNVATLEPVLPYPLAFHYHRSDVLDKTTFSYQTIDPSQNEVRLVDSRIIGQFSYIDSQGQPAIAYYETDSNGYQVLDSNYLPGVPTNDDIPYMAETIPIHPYEYMEEEMGAQAQFMKVYQETMAYPEIFSDINEDEDSSLGTFTSKTEAEEEYIAEEFEDDASSVVFAAEERTVEHAEDIVFPGSVGYEDEAIKEKKEVFEIYEEISKARETSTTSPEESTYTSNEDLIDRNENIPSDNPEPESAVVSPDNTEKNTDQPAAPPSLDDKEINNKTQETKEHSSTLPEETEEQTHENVSETDTHEDVTAAEAAETSKNIGTVFVTSSTAEKTVSKSDDSEDIKTADEETIKTQI